MAPTGWIALLLLWILFFWWYRDYRLDYFRQELFALRDELFDVALDGEIEFQNHAYGMLRSTINGTIQYGHQLGFLDLLCSLVFTSRNETQKELVGRYEDRWQRACDKLDPEVSKKLKVIRNRLHLITAEQVVFTSFFLVATLFALVFAVLLRFVQRSVVRSLQRVFTAARIHQLVTTLDCTAAMRAS